MERILRLVGGALGVALTCSLLIHGGALALSPEFFLEYLLPFAEAPQAALTNEWTLALYLALTQAIRPGFAAGILAWAFSTLGARPPLPLRPCFVILFSGGVLVLGRSGWLVARGLQAGNSRLGIAGDLLGAARIPALIALALGVLALYLGRVFRRPTAPAEPPGSPATPPAPEPSGECPRSD